MAGERLDGTVALVTGAASGIGAATALALSELGASVAVAARREERLEALAAKIRDKGGTAFVHQTDVSDETQAGRLVTRTVDEFGRLDTLVNSAGLMLLGPVVDATPAEWRRMVDINLMGLMYCTQAALPHLLRASETGSRRVADVVNLSGVMGRGVRLGTAGYAASKHAVGAFSEALRLEVTRRHLRVSLVEPGAMISELADHTRPAIKAALKARYADVEWLQTADIADAICYIVTRPWHVAVNEMLVRPTEQDI
jgi:NADP-dependent 3-hydroxy acid dehydrogenase YdfG